MTIGLHLDLALSLLDAGQVFNVTFMEGKPVMMETTTGGLAVTVSVPDFVLGNPDKFSEGEIEFMKTGPAVLTREAMEDLAKTVLPRNWSQSIGARPLHGTLKVHNRNPMRCSFFLFTNTDGTPPKPGGNEVQQPEDEPFDSGYRGLIGCAVRILPTKPFALAQLRLSQSAIAIADIKGGLVLIVGAPGVGKSSTAAAYIDHRNTSLSGSIVTAEDPIEVPIASKASVVSQREVGVNVASVAVALRDAERNFAHSALVGEIQTSQDAIDTFTAARHGLFVVATTFADNATSAVKSLAAELDRAGSDGADLVSSTLLAVVFQVRLPSTTQGKWEFAYESLVIHGNADVQRAIRERNWESLQQHVAAEKGADLNSSLAELVRHKKVRREAALLQAYDKQGIAAVLQEGSLRQ